MRIFIGRKPLVFAAILCAAFFCGCIGNAASAQEYFSIGMAYFELGKYEEAEKWLNRAKASDRTMTASQYNLGRLAFETKKYEEAAKHFEGILKRDPDNVLALKAAAYTRIKTGDLKTAEKHYNKLLALVPDSIDDGYNHALVLYAMERYEDAEKVLENFPFAIQDNNDVLLLYARSQKAQNKAEAMDNYAKWLDLNADSKVRYEYAQILEHHGMYARAIEEYRKILSDTAATATAAASTSTTTTAAAAEPKRSDVRFSLARVLLIADSDSREGITELETAVSEGFKDIDAVEELMKNSSISSSNRDSLRGIVNNMQRTAEQAQREQAQREQAQRDREQTEQALAEEQTDQNLEVFSETNP